MKTFDDYLNDADRKKQAERQEEETKKKREHIDKKRRHDEKRACIARANQLLHKHRGYQEIKRTVYHPQLQQALKYIWNLHYSSERTAINILRWRVPTKKRRRFNPTIHQPVVTEFILYDQIIKATYAEYVFLQKDILVTENDLNLAIMEVLSRGALVTMHGGGTHTVYRSQERKSGGPVQISSQEANHFSLIISWNSQKSAIEYRLGDNSHFSSLDQLLEHLAHHPDQVEHPATFFYQDSKPDHSEF